MEQHHRVVEFGRGLWISSSPSPLLKQVTQVVQSGLEYLQGWTLHNSSGQLVSEDYLHREIVFSYVQAEFLVF